MHVSLDATATVCAGLCRYGRHPAFARTAGRSHVLDCLQVHHWEALLLSLAKPTVKASLFAGQDNCLTQGMSSGRLSADDA